uniref:Uncharacterized protein n=1 Tax=Brassica oleracea var. oleracea TaxID=109376 RepID=A0A0D2ZYA7_BRAOL
MSCLLHGWDAKSRYLQNSRLGSRIWSTIFLVRGNTYMVPSSRKKFLCSKSLWSSRGLLTSLTKRSHKRSSNLSLTSSPNSSLAFLKPPCKFHTEEHICF